MSRRRTGELAGPACVVALLGLGAAVSAGCGPAAMYPGPRRPDSQVAFIEPRGLRVIDLDRVSPPMSSRYAVLDGEHSLLVAPGVDFASQGAEGAVQTRVCVQIERGHTYVVRSAAAGSGGWRPEVLDGASMEVVPTRLIDPSRSRCPHRTYLVTRSPSPTATPVGSPAAADEQPAAGAAPAPVMGAIDQEQPAQEQPAAPAAPPVRRVDAIDEEAPPPGQPVAARPDGRVVAHPGSGFGIGTGLSFGGDKLATARFTDGSTDDLSAGDGFYFQISGAITPLWSANDAVGFGLGGEIGLKYASIGDSSTTISLTRFPAIAFAQLIAPAGPNGSFLLRAGVETDLGVSISSDAPGLSGSVDLDSGTGFMAETGVWYQFNQASAMTITARYTHIRYGFPNNGPEVDGSNFSMLVGFLFGSAKN